MNTISNLAFVHPEAKLGDNIVIDAFAFVDKGTEIGDGCHIHPQATIRAGARIGRNCKIFEGAVVSAKPQDFRWKGEIGFVEIGDDTVIREHVIINRSIHEGGATKIGNGCFIMAQCHIGHDSVIGDSCVLGNAVHIAGQCKVGNYTILSSNALMHEKTEVGEWALIKGGTRVTGNVPPYVIMAHNPISYYGINAFILRKGGLTEEQIDDIAKCYRHLYQCHTSVENALRRIKADVPESDSRQAILDFIIGHDQKIAGVNLEDFID